MKRKKNMTVSTRTTRRALGMNVLSLLLCVSMLIGTTFAWFTDSVNSGRNQIIAGNLDVEVYHSSTTADAAAIKTEGSKVDSETQLFDITYWEPGMVAYENFVVANVGDMAFKYKMALREWAYNTINNGDDDLRDVLTIAVIEGGFTPAGESNEAKRASVKTAAAAGSANLFDTEKNGTLYPAGTQGQKSEEVFGVVIYWEPTDNDNIYNVNNGKQVDTPAPDGSNRLYIELGIDVVASQLEYENDSFDNTYDDEAKLADLPERVDGTGSSKGIRKSSTEGKVTEDVVNEGEGDAKSEVQIDVKMNVRTETSTTSTSTVAGATVPAPAAIAVMDDMFTEENGFEAAPEAEEGQQVNQDDVLVLTLNVETIEATTDSMTLDVTMDGLATRTITIAEAGKETQTTEKELSQSISVLTKPVTVEINLAKNLENVAVTHTHAGETAVAMESVDSVDELDDGKFFYDKATGKLTLMTSKFSEFKITYLEPEPAGVSLDKSVVLVKGGTKTLTATVTPDTVEDKSVTWESSDKTVATVNENTGEITAKDVGEATITAALKTDSSRSAECTVYVGWDPAELLFGEGGTAELVRISS